MNQQVTGLILTWNEEANIGRTLEALTSLTKIVVVDSGSTDATAAIVNSFPNTVLFTRPFDAHANQWNFGLLHCGIDSEWVLALDADYLVSAKLLNEIEARIQETTVNGFRMHFQYAINGKTISSGIYPPVTALFRRNAAVYVQEGHTQRLQLTGQTGELKHKAVHDDRKPMSRWIQSQLSYANLEAALLISTKPQKTADRLRKLLPMTPFIVFLYCIFVKSGWRDGPAGWMYAWQRLLAEVFIQYQLIVLRMRS